MALTRKSADEVAKQIPYDAGQHRDSKLAVAFPTLVEFLFREGWEDGAPRERGTLLICAGDGRWRAWVNDKDSQREAWVSSESLEGLLKSVEQGLVADSLGWRQGRGAKGRR